MTKYLTSTTKWQKGLCWFVVSVPSWWKDIWWSKVSYLLTARKRERERRGEDMGDERWTNKISLRSIKVPYVLQLKLAP